MTKIRLQKATLNNWKLVEKLEKNAKGQFFCPCKGETEYKNYIKTSNVFLIMANEIPIGTISYKIKSKTALINGLTLLPQYRGQGIATNTMKKILTKLKNKNIELVVHPQNTPAIIIYLHLGFKIMGWKENYFGNGQPRLLLKKLKV